MSFIRKSDTKEIPAEVVAYAVNRVDTEGVAVVIYRRTILPTTYEFIATTEDSDHPAGSEQVYTYAPSTRVVDRMTSPEVF